MTLKRPDLGILANTFKRFSAIFHPKRLHSALELSIKDGPAREQLLLKTSLKMFGSGSPEKTPAGLRLVLRTGSGNY